MDFLRLTGFIREKHTLALHLSLSLVFSYWFVNLAVTDKHGTKIYRDLSALGSSARKRKSFTWINTKYHVSESCKEEVDKKSKTLRHCFCNLFIFLLSI